MAQINDEEAKAHIGIGLHVDPDSNGTKQARLRTACKGDNSRVETRHARGGAQSEA